MIAERLDELYAIKYGLNIPDLFNIDIFKAENVSGTIFKITLLFQQDPKSNKPKIEQGGDQRITPGPGLNVICVTDAHGLKLFARSRLLTGPSTGSDSGNKKQTS